MVCTGDGRGSWVAEEGRQAETADDAAVSGRGDVR